MLLNDRAKMFISNCCYIKTGIIVQIQNLVGPLHINLHIFLFYIILSISDYILFILHFMFKYLIQYEHIYIYIYDSNITTI